METGMKLDPQPSQLHGLYAHLAPKTRVLLPVVAPLRVVPTADSLDRAKVLGCRFPGIFESGFHQKEELKKHWIGQQVWLPQKQLDALAQNHFPHTEVRLTCLARSIPPLPQRSQES